MSADTTKIKRKTDKNIQQLKRIKASKVFTVLGFKEVCIESLYSFSSIRKSLKRAFYQRIYSCEYENVQK